MSNIIEVKDICFSYEDKLILNNISFNIEEGTFVSIIGPNGSGKTTLLKNISSAYSPHQGSVMFRGKDVRRYKKKELAKKLAYVSQNTSIDFEFTVMDVVLMGRTPYMSVFQTETEKDIEIAIDAMASTNTLELKDKKITEISGGERQRVMIACALAQTPEAILLDEPVSNLDISHQIDVLSILKRLNRKNNATVVAVLHDLNLAVEYSDVIVLVKDGKLIKCGPPKDVITEENIRMAYKADIYMSENPVTGNPHIIPLVKI